MMPHVQNIKPLYIPKTMKWKGLTVYCRKCKTNVSDICKESKKPIRQCVNGDKHYLKIYLHVSGTDNERKTKTLTTRDLNEAILQAIAFEKEVKGSNHQIVERKEIQKSDGNRPILLVQALARYIAWLNNENVPVHMRKERSIEHIKDVERAFKTLALCLKNNKEDISTFRVEDINNDIVGIIYASLEEKKFSNRTFNKYFSYYTSFLKWYIKEYDLPMKNYFESVKRKNLNYNPEAITKEEYALLLKQITPENGIKEYEGGKKHQRNMYRPYLKDAIRIALETGRRREELISLKWNNIKDSSIVVEDYKVNRIQNRINQEEKKLIYIPITDSLQVLLNEMGYEKYMNTDKYIIAPELKAKRTRVLSDILSKGFTYYYNQLNTGRKLTFKCLRKTYITNLQLYMGSNTRAITGHSDDKVIQTNYIDKKQIAKAMKGFNIFSSEERIEELEKVRANTKDQNREVEL